MSGRYQEGYVAGHKKGMKDGGEMSMTDKYAPLSKDETIAGLKAEIERLLAMQTVFENVNCTDRAEIERLTADNHKLMLWNEQLQAELDIARRALEGK